MVILKMQPPNTSQETKDDLYLMAVWMTTLGQQTPWLRLHTTDKM